MRGLRGLGTRGDVGVTWDRDVATKKYYTQKVVVCPGTYTYGVSDDTRP